MISQYNTMHNIILHYKQTPDTLSLAIIILAIYHFFVFILK